MAMKRLDYLVAALNATNNATSYPFTEPITGLPIPGGGLLAGDYIDITLGEATSFSTAMGSSQALYEGRYKYIQVDASATAGNVKAGTVAARLSTVSAHVVTDYAHAMTGGQNIDGVFLNSIAPGNWGWIQCRGRASVLGSASFTAVPAIGDVVTVTTNGVVTDLTQSGAVLLSNQFLQVGIAMTLPAVNVLFQVKLVIPFSAY